MTKDEPRGKDDDGDKKRPFKCCSCRSTREHRCYKCFCGKCPTYTKKVPPRYGVKDQFPDSQPSNSSSKLGRSKESIVSGQAQTTDSSPKQQSVETSDRRRGDEHHPGFFSNPSTLRSWPAIRSGTRADGAKDNCSQAISPNSRAESSLSSHPSIDKKQRGNDEVGNQKVTTNEVDVVSSKAHAGSSSNWDALAEKELRGNQEVGNQKVTTVAVEGGSSKLPDGSSSIWDVLVEKRLRASQNQTGWANKAGSASSWGMWRVNGSRDYATATTSSWDTWCVNKPRGKDEVGSPKVMTNEVDSGSCKLRDVSSSNWDDLAEKTLKASGNQMGWANKAGSASSWGTWRVNRSRDNVAGTTSSWGTWCVNEPKAKDELGNQKLTTNEIEGGYSNLGNGSSSNWDAWAEKIPKGNQTGWAYKTGSTSNWSTRRVNGSRGSREVMANQAQGRSSKPVSLRPHVESSSRWTSYTGKRSRGDQERRANRIEDASSRPWKKSRGRHEIVAYTTKDRSSEPSWLKPHVQSGSSRALFTVKESRGKHEVKASRTEGGSYKSVSHSAPSRSNSSWDSYIVKDARDNVNSAPRNQEAIANGANDGTFKQVLNPQKPVLSPHAQSGSSLPSSTIKGPRGNQEIMAYRAENGSSVPVMHKPNAGFISTMSLHNPEETIYRAGDGSSKQVSHNHHAQPGSNWDSLTIKEPNGNREIRAENGSSIPVLHNPNPGFVSIPPPSLHNPEEAIYRAEDESSKRVLHYHYAQSGSSGDALTVKEPSGNQEIMGYRAESGSSLPVLSNNAGFVSTPPLLTSKEPTGHSISEKESVKDGQQDVKLLSKKLEGIVRADKKFNHPAVSSLRHAKAPPSALSGKSYSSQNLVRVGPASQVLWAGHIELLHADNKMFEIFLAHSAAKVSRKAYKIAAQMGGVLQFKIHPRRAFWPKIFQSDCPDARDVALYFYPERSGRSIEKYRELLKLLEQQDLMLRSVMEQVELLVFSSKLLHSEYQILDGCIYMWGVFRKFGSNEVSCSAEALPTPHLEPAQAIANATRTPERYTISPSLQKQM